MPRVLVVDDEVGVRAALARGLKAEGMDVVTASDGPTALRAALSNTFDVILLDIIIPGLSGYRVARLRAEGIATPVLLISAKDGEVDQADGLDLGADGYLVKPFSFLVLLARIRALLRRQDDTRPGQLRLGELTVDPVAKQARWSGRSVELSSREFALLHALVRRQDTVLSKDELMRAAWGGDQAATRNAVEVYVGYLRRKLADAGVGLLIDYAPGSCRRSPNTYRPHGCCTGPDACAAGSADPPRRERSIRRADRRTRRSAPAARSRGPAIVRQTGISVSLWKPTHHVVPDPAAAVT